MPALFSTLTASANPASISSFHTSPKRRLGFLGRSSFFSRSSSSTVTTAPSIPLESTASASRAAAPILPAVPTSPLEHLSSARPIGTPAAIAKFLSTTSPPSSATISLPADSTGAALLVSLLPSALSNTSLGPSCALQPSTSDHLGGISASTSRNTVLPASHPILNSSVSATGSTFLPPSTSGGPLPTLASAIKLPSPAGPTCGNQHQGPATGSGSLLFRNNDLQAKSQLDASRKEADELTALSAATAPVHTLPRSTSGTSLFGTSRMRRMASRASIFLGDADRKASRKVSAPINRDSGGPALPGGGETLGRRLSRRLSIDNIRPLFPGKSTAKRRSVIARDRQLDIQQWVKGASTSVTAAPAPPGAISLTESEQPSVSDKKGKVKERLALPGIRSWRSKFAKPSAMTMRNGGDSEVSGSAPGSSRPSLQCRGKRDSWVDVGSVLEVGIGVGSSQVASLEGPAANGSKALLAALKWDGMAASEDPKEENLAIGGVPGCRAAHSDIAFALEPSPRQAKLLETLLARPSADGLAALGSTASIPATLSDADHLLSPAADDRSLLEPTRSPLAVLSSSTSSLSSTAGGETDTAGAIGPALGSPDCTGTDTATHAEALPVSASHRSLPPAESALSFHTAQSGPVSPPRPAKRRYGTTPQTAATMPRSRSRPIMDRVSESSSTLIERTEREQGEGWWSVAAPAPRAHTRPSQAFLGAEMGSQPTPGASALRRSSAALASAASARRPISAASTLWTATETRRQSSPALLPEYRERRRSATSLSLITRPSPADTLRRTQGPSRLSTNAGPHTDGDAEAGPDSPRRARAIAMEAARQAIRVPPTLSRTVRPKPTAASIASPVRSDGRRRDSYGHPSIDRSGDIPPSVLDLRAAYYEELERLKDKHSYELESLVDALCALEHENAELRVKSRQSALRAREEWEKRMHEKDRVVNLEKVMKRLRGQQLELKPEEELFGPELMSFKLGAEAVGVPRIRLYEDAYSSADLMKSPTPRHSRASSASTSVARDADEFGRLKGSPSSARGEGK